MSDLTPFTAEELDERRRWVAEHRDDALVLYDVSTERWLLTIDALAAERDGQREVIAHLQGAWQHAERERDEARADVEHLTAEVTLLREAIEAIVKLAEDDPYAYHHHAPFHAAVHIARRVLAEKDTDQ